MANKQKHWRLSLMYSKYWWDGNLDFQDDHNKEYLVDGSFAQDNEILLALVVVRVLDLFQSQRENSLLSLACPHHVPINSPHPQATDLLGRHPYFLVHDCLFRQLVLTKFPNRWLRSQLAPPIPTVTIMLVNITSLGSRNWPSLPLGTLWGRFWQITLQEITR